MSGSREGARSFAFSLALWELLADLVVEVDLRGREASGKESEGRVRLSHESQSFFRGDHGRGSLREWRGRRGSAVRQGRGPLREGDWKSEHVCVDSYCF